MCSSDLLSDDGHMLMTTSYTSVDGWLWRPPTEKSVAKRYISAVVKATRELEKTELPHEVIEALQLRPFVATELARTEWWNMLQRIGTGGDVATEVATFTSNANAAAQQ